MITLKGTLNHNSRQFKTSRQVSPPKDAQYLARCASTADPTTTSATLRLQTSARKYKHWPRPRQLLVAAIKNRDEDRLRAVPNNVIVLDKCLKLTMIKASCRLQYFSILLCFPLTCHCQSWSQLQTFVNEILLSSSLQYSTIHGLSCCVWMQLLHIRLQDHTIEQQPCSQGWVFWPQEKHKTNCLQEPTGLRGTVNVAKIQNFLKLAPHAKHLRMDPRARQTLSFDSSL